MQEENILEIYMKDGVVLAVQFESGPEYPFIILKDEPGKDVDDTWTVYSPLMDIHEEVIDIEELYKYIGLSIVEFQLTVRYRNAGDTEPEKFKGALREMTDQAKTWDVQHKEYL